MNGDPLSASLGGEPSSSSRRRRRHLLLLPPSSFPPSAAEELSSFDAMFSGVSLRSLLLDNPVSSSPSPSPFSPSSSSSSPSPSSPLWSPLPSPVSPFSPSPEQQHLSFRYSAPSPLKMPKQEPPHCFFPDFAPASSPFDPLSLADDSTLCFPLHRLSDLLRSLETLQPQLPQPPPAAAAAAPGPARKRSPADPERMKRAREKRRKIGDRMRQLHGLVMPQEERKMDTLATLEEACKQVAYLQQLVKSALQLMPHESPQPARCFPPRCPTEADVGGGGGGGGGTLGRWTMQHLLERMVNSPPAQAVLCDQEYGVGAATNQQWLLLKQQEEEEEAASSAMRMEMQQQQMWWNLEAPPYQSPV